MASDYGDDAGEKMIDDFMRFGERMGERAMYRRAERLKLAFENATDKARGAAAADGGRAEPAGRGCPVSATHFAILQQRFRPGRGGTGRGRTPETAGAVVAEKFFHSAAFLARRLLYMQTSSRGPYDRNFLERENAL